MAREQKIGVTNERTDEPSDLDRLLSVEQAANVLGISVWTVRKWICDGKIKSAKLGSRRMIPMSVLKKFINDAISA